jgi:tetratricopeptide (TPR) repeat protein
LDELLNRRLLLEMTEGQTITPDPIYTFSHQKVSEVVYGEMGTARRRLLHRRAFETLQASQAVAAECAYHALQAGLTAETIRYSFVAGNEAMNLFAVSVAIPHYETAWQIAEQQGWPQTISSADRQLLYSGLGRAYELNEKWTRAEETYRAMIAAAQSIKSPAMECLALNQLATIYYLKFNKEEQAVTLLNRSLALSKQHGDRRGMVEAELHLAMAAFQNSNHALTLHHAEQALDTARELGHPQLMAHHLSILSYVALQQRKWDKLEAYAAEASQLYTNAGNLVLAADCERIVGLGQLLIVKPQEALVTIEKTAIFSRHIENLWGEAECTWKLAYIHLELGHYGLAIKLGEEGIMMTRQLDMPTAVSLSLIVGSIVQRKCLSLAAAKETLLEIVTVYKERIFEIIWDWALAELCATYALAGEWQQAVEYAKQRLDTRQNDSYLSMSLSGWYEIEALLRSSDGDAARAEVVRMAGLVGNNKRYRLTLHRSQAVLAQWDGDVVQAVMHLENALTLAREMALPGEEWPILGELGRLYAAQGEDEKARAAYREAGMIIRRLAETIDDERLREGFVMAVSTRTLLNQTKPT